MSATQVAHSAMAPDEGVRRNHVPGEAGIWIFILGDMGIFAVLFATFLVYRSKDVALFDDSQQHLNTTFGLINTLLLLASSMLVVLAVSAVRKGTPRPAPLLIAGAIGCGLAFSVLKVVEYTGKIDAGITPQTNTFYMFYFLLTGLHWFHLLLGLAVLSYLLVSARRDRHDARQLAWFEGGGCFWHMVDLLWIVLFPLIYLLN
ncbi:cytochrome c oxidase subunit 3 family protein [Mycobacterium sp. CVI_P3]|uniref:Probable cytochrome c oxidase subunit 3 n=1 Tax=Mycobacterium pinniadriaticum TaxID=2994102 RepID=A0ABT3SA32_9MYCO|nr:cytochrome c oxidase subunit 3 family protein [Mycobacterium pinniadriaticum]MCX2929980.1 cytochrome c oxidase subunit 3 family protein [Mycobacterium pinniadriaticum]MCX2936371.1 cytochrome c oxidase subunit 3 family protein [Mycobacterium pinniadriaticum]